MASLSTDWVHGYLGRVGHSRASVSTNVLPGPTLPTLARLHRDHICTIPFENLSLKLEAARQQHEIFTDLPAIYNKLVVSKRGGYCFEQNGLLGAVLRSLGFDVIDAAARVVQSGEERAAELEEAPPLCSQQTDNTHTQGVLQPVSELRLSGHDHRILLVHIGGQTWLADVGFGGECIPLPLLLPPGAEHYAPPEEHTAAAAYSGQPWADELPVGRMQQYRLRLGLPGLLAAPDPAATPHFGTRAGYYLQKQSDKDGRWKDLYFFRLDEFLPQDFAMQNHYIVHHPESHFQKNLVVARHTEEGRVTVLNDAFRLWRGGEVEEQHIGSEEQLLDILEEHFGIRL